jgi:hypothetical protein
MVEGIDQITHTTLEQAEVVHHLAVAQSVCLQ